MKRLTAAALLAALAGAPAAADLQSLLEASERMDAADQRDVDEALERARRCTRSRDWACAESAITAAARRGNAGAAQRKALDEARNGLKAERELERREREEAEARERERERVRERERREAEEEAAEERRQARLARERAESERRADEQAASRQALLQQLQRQGQQQRSDLERMWQQNNQQFAQLQRQQEQERRAQQERQRAEAADALRRRQELERNRQSAEQRQRLQAAERDRSQQDAERERQRRQQADLAERQRREDAERQRREDALAAERQRREQQAADEAERRRRREAEAAERERQRQQQEADRLAALPRVGGPPNKDGCWIPERNKPWCVVVTKSVIEHGEARVTYRNDCAWGVYVGYGNQRKDGSWDSGADHLAPGRSTTWWTGGGNGEYRYKFTGSDRASADWVCAGADPGWKD